jgi:transcriptional repressor NF-X1
MMPAPLTLHRRDIDHRETDRISVTTRPVNTLMSMREILVDRIRQDRLECTVCYEGIGRTAGIWSCPVCYVIFHFTCIQSWIQQCLKGIRMINFRSSENSWRCPCCQTVETSIPHLDRCFCGQVCRPRNRRSSLWLAHSCGQPCGRLGRHRYDNSNFQYTCLHPCAMICHPGPCPDCTVAPVNIPCYCGATNLSMACHQVAQISSNRSCGRPCRRQLDCGLHRCEKLCHAGSCDSCSYQTRIRCHCGRQERDLTCRMLLVSTVDKDGFSCGELCLKTDACLEMLHPCQKICHSGSCGSLCAFDPSLVKTCHCGKRSLRELSERPRLRCTSPIPTCNQICGLSLSCPSNRLLDLVKHSQLQRHQCPKPCHNDLCTFSCTQKVTLACRCGSSQEIIECHQLGDIVPADHNHEDLSVTTTVHRPPLITGLDVLSSLVSVETDRSEQASPFSLWNPETLYFYTTKTCHRRCDQQLSCQRHFCHEICCPFHRHRPNQLSDQQQYSYYDIGSQTPTATTAATKTNSDSTVSIIDSPRCQSLCLKWLSCGKHVCEANCHQGPCLPCSHYELDDVMCKCGTLLYKSPVACRDEMSYKLAVSSRGLHPCRRPRLCGHADHHYCHAEETCPPCMFPVHRTCPCRRKWLLRNVPCSQSSVSCGALCQNPLPCGVHVCQRPCHRLRQFRTFS